ncbi:hypothetical protein LCGC14_1490170 [marine sediment metagenome]|uniref:Uncharacterized protein n=1 Tax=marine sediment metagenome TaxID=412755 RepID=A0A0F9LMF8_9ZZZZ
MRQPWEQNSEAWKYTPEEIAQAEEVRRRTEAGAQKLGKAFEKLGAALASATVSLQRFSDVVMVEELTRATLGEES